jgi:hypothetical protein
MGLQNCVSTNGQPARESYVHELLGWGRSKAALRNLLLRNSTGIIKDVTAEHNLPLKIKAVLRKLLAKFMGSTKGITPGQVEIKFVSALTLADILGPFDHVDFVEADLQESEIVVFPPCMDVLKKKVRRIHLNTHSRDTHRILHNMFAEKGWEIVFSFEPDSTHDSVLGTFRTNDGVLTVRNPDRWANMFATPNTPGHLE